MTKEYIVHGAGQSTVQGQAQLADGTTAEVAYAALIVELVPNGHDSGTIKLEFHGAEAPAAMSMFVPGSVITATFEPKGA